MTYMFKELEYITIMTGSKAARRQGAEAVPGHIHFDLQAIDR